MPVAVPLIAAGVGAAGSVISSRNAANAQSRAASATQAATDAATAEQRRQYDLTRADNAPFLATGTSALSGLASLYGLNGQTQSFDGFTASPDYQFRQDEQARALTARNSALGIQDSGAAQKAALKYSGNLASGEFNNYANRLAGIAGVGQTAVGANQTSGQNFANNYSNLQTNNAAALGSSYTNTAAIQNQNISNLSNLGTGLINNYPWASR